ncbi:hypothetical protein G3O08_13900 [Cryomorpha ignava]|uniref:Glycoamylase-like domain-containing protein n=1 Tax=Cryomorpha ignava TaxID=101383 RepID=A0A7K3WSD3_9FLAO|nr:glucoamylase family protein [Cryomorpha ignava]NEN24597.1 hypothetical protein [Cryomorpha ignava]
MKSIFRISLIILVGLCCIKCDKDDDPTPPVVPSADTTTYSIQLEAALIDGVNFFSSGRIKDIDRSLPGVLTFNRPIDPTNLTNQTIRVAAPGISGNLSWELSDSNRTVTIFAPTILAHIQKYKLILSNNIKGAEGESFPGYEREFYTEVDSTPKFPLIDDEALMTLVQEQTFRYFWDFGHPVSGLARERNSSGNTVTIGGSGFGVMSILVGIERNFISRTDGVDRLNTIVDFLTTADRFHGAWPHWMNGNTGSTIPFSANDNGADLVETAFMIQGLLTVREYLDAGNPNEADLIAKINILWEEVEWDWFTQGQNVLYWHWSPNLGFIMNMKIRGYNEGLIVYLLAASSPTHPISAEVYHQGWAQNGAMQNGNTYLGTILPLGPSYGGPLFFAHYSFLGFNPSNLSDQYANYWTQNVNHTMINRQFCINNPNNYVGYSPGSWGLTASDNEAGYSAHSPTNDRGVITPTAALSSMPYTPEESMDAIRYFYFTIGDKLWGEYGFYDAYNFTAGWVAGSYLAIDQGPIIVMIENHRTGLLWNYFMQAPEVEVGMDELGFSN